MSTRSQVQEYMRTLDELRQAFSAWGATHPGVLVHFDFPANDKTMAVLSELPEEWCGNEAARELVLYCIGQVPSATVGMFRTVCVCAAREQ